MRSVWMAGLVAVLGTAAVGCVIQPEDGSKYREPLPEQGSVSLALPGSSAGGASTQSVHLNGGQSSGGAVASDAEFYRFSRDLTDTIDTNTAGILAIIWAVAQTPPTTVSGNTATWGPSADSNALDPIVWRLQVQEVATDEFDYHVDARPKSSTSDADFKTFLKGHGYGKKHALHDSGWFQADNEAYRSLDPARAKDRGLTKITYDVRQFPKTIAVEVRPNDGTGQADAKVQHLAQGAGILDVVAKGDLEDAKDGKLEDIVIKSQWNSTGAGRADAKVSGGSLPIASVDIVECWSNSFSRSYYKDSADTKPSSGSESACAFK